MCFLNSQECIKIDNLLSSSFNFDNGLRQSDLLFPLLFNLVLKWVICKMQQTKVGLSLAKTYNTFTYADDIDIIAGNKKN